MDILPRFIRHKNAPAYLGVDRNKFNAEIRPFLTAIPLGRRSLAFDRHELDAWADKYKLEHGQPGRLMAYTPPPDVGVESTSTSPSTRSKKNYSQKAPPAPAPEKRGPRKLMGTVEERSAALVALLNEMRSRPKRKK